MRLLEHQHKGDENVQQRKEKGGKVRILSIRAIRYEVSVRITSSFANSLGWKSMEPNCSHRCAPPPVLPFHKTRARSAALRMYRKVANLFQVFGFTRKKIPERNDPDNDMEDLFLKERMRGRCSINTIETQEPEGHEEQTASDKPRIEATEQIQPFFSLPIANFEEAIKSRFDAGHIFRRFPRRTRVSGARFHRTRSQTSVCLGSPRC